MPKCKYESCIEKAVYGIPYGIPKYCENHKNEYMIDLKVRRCVHVCCIDEPIYDYFPNRKGILCEQHKLDGMVKIKVKGL